MKPPIKGYKNLKYPAGHVSQWFGENVAMYKAAIGTNGHNGIDIVAPWGTPIYAVEGGQVVEVKDSPDGYGKHLRILSPVNNEGIGNEWTYGHASKNIAKIGDMVEAGDLIQEMGNTGFVVSGATPYWKHNPYAGTHLHLGIRKYKITDHKNGWRYSLPSSPFIRILNYGNGFLGAVDFREVLDFKEPEDPEIIRGLQLTVISLLNQILAFYRPQNR